LRKITKRQILWLSWSVLKCFQFLLWYFTWKENKS